MVDWSYSPTNQGGGQTGIDHAHLSYTPHFWQTRRTAVHGNLIPKGQRSVVSTHGVWCVAQTGRPPRRPGRSNGASRPKPGPSGGLLSPGLTLQPSGQPPLRRLNGWTQMLFHHQTPVISSNFFWRREVGHFWNMYTANTWK